MTPLDNFRIACRMITTQVPSRAIEYAIGYARFGLQLQDHEIRAAHVQALYVLNNITHWRGPDAKEVRALLKQFIKETEK